jgi:hypothetical protein
VDRGAIGGTTDTITNLSIATNNGSFTDSDLFKFTLDVTRNATITVSPFGPTYLEGPQGGPVSSFNAQAQMDLQVQLFAADGSTILGTANATGVGASEVLTMTGVSAESYYIKVSPAPGATDHSQMYMLCNAVSGAAVVSTSVALNSTNDLVITDSATVGRSTISTSSPTPGRAGSSSVTRSISLAPRSPAPPATQPTR